MLYGLLLAALLNPAETPATSPAKSEPAAAAAPRPEQLKFFEKTVRPLLFNHCQNCHGAKKQWGGLRLDSRAAILKGGESGPAAVAGQPEQSLLIRAVRHTDENLKMPEDNRLTDRQIEDLVEWVKQGLPFPETVAKGALLRDPDHWSFQPPKEQPLPAVQRPEWSTNPIDRFVLAKLEAAGLTPAEPAERRALLRRATYDLTGLPPTPEELQAFLSDESPQAFERVVDRLLSSPHYGEHWGRHWLDVARYADSNGLDENVAQGNAWRYRDYVVQALNQDKPFNQFVREQLAGDLLPAATDEQRREQLVATGFLGIGPKVLAETDEAKMRMDILDEQLDTTGKTFLGLTLGCARCHDHKFDPVDTADYYGLAGIFKSTRSMRKYTKLAEWYENMLPAAENASIQQAWDAGRAARQKSVADLIAMANQKLLESMPADSKLPEKPETMYPEATQQELKKLRADLAAWEKTGPDLPSAMGVTDDAVVDVAVHLRGNPLKLGEVIPRRAIPAIRGPLPPQFSTKESGRRELADWLVDPNHPLTSRVFVNRVWNWHFGTGLVRSTDNFGQLGERPSHPELLDWLARQFIADGWSIKSLHRRILLSRTWQQSSLATPESMLKDPDNRLLSHFTVRRLEAESVRDALLAVSGQLDPRLGGSLLKLKNRDYFFDHTSKDLTTYDSPRRSLYLPVVRNNVFEMFQLLDFPDPTVSSSSRNSTVVAPQALLMMNSDFVMQSSDALARRILQAHPDNPERLRMLYLLAYGREPTPTEQQADLAFVAAAMQMASSSPDTALTSSWAALCQVIVAANEFVYLK